MTMMIVMVMMEIRMEFNDDVPYGIIRHGWLGKPLQMEVLMGGIIDLCKWIFQLEGIY